MKYEQKLPMTKRIQNKWTKLGKSGFLGSNDVAVWKTKAYIPSLDVDLTKKQLIQLFRECTSALKKMKNL